MNQKGSFGPPSDKKVPQSKKYANVKSSIDTGASASKTVTVPTATVIKRRDEIFKRIRPATIVSLLQERNVSESVFSLGGDDDARPGAPAGADLCSVMSAAVPSQAAASRAAGSVPASVAPSMASMAGSVLSVIETDMTIDEARDLVLLDLREPEEFQRCHLPLATSYPAQLINRDQVSPELHRCKRDSSKLLVIYHTNDQTTAAVAALLVQKGWENAHALSGGFDELVENYPEVLEGDVPERPATGSTVRGSTARTAPKPRARP